MRAGLGPKRSARGKTKHLVLPRPFRWQVGEAGNAHAVRQPAIDGGLGEIGGKESHVDLSRAAVLSLCYVVRICCWISDELVRRRAYLAPDGEVLRHLPALWVKSGHFRMSERCPLYPQWLTWVGTVVMSALGQ